MQTLSLQLPEPLLVRLDRECRLRGTDKLTFVRAAIEHELASRKPTRRPSCFDSPHDLAGPIEGLPQDMATNSPPIERAGQLT